MTQLREDLVAVSTALDQETQRRNNLEVALSEIFGMLVEREARNQAMTRVVLPRHYYDAEINSEYTPTWIF